MPRYIAFLRGINVGGHRVKMDHLRGLFEELEFEKVATFIASGNVIFSAESDNRQALGDEIERHLHRELGYEVATFLRNPAELDAMAAFESAALAAGDPPASSVYVMLMADSASQEMQLKFADLQSEMDRFEFSGNEVYWLIQGKISESPLFGGGMEGAVRGVPTTMRNMNTIRRLIAKLGADR